MESTCVERSEERERRQPYPSAVSPPRRVFMTGATGYLGRPLTEALLTRGHRVQALVRAASVARLAPRVEPVLGDALDPSPWARAVRAGDVVVQLVGVAHPSPRKAPEFERLDRGSAEATAQVARSAGASRLVYVSVAQPAPIMQAYIAARAAGEAAVRATGLPATILRPWYVLGPGHRWPLLLWPFYGMASLLPRSRATARRLGLVTRAQMLAALIQAIESTEPGVEIVEVPEIRRALAGQA
jgi:uncharacterized protein YbjT (DUF2867 family)